MAMTLHSTTIIVRDQDEALRFLSNCSAGRSVRTI